MQEDWDSWNKITETAHYRECCGWGEKIADPSTARRGRSASLLMNTGLATQAEVNVMRW
jgi:hypothetical protein